MKARQSAILVYALLVCTALMSACSSPGYNDNPSQQITTARVGCLAATDFFSVYFNVHIQPSNDNQDSKIKRERFRSYCSNIPAPGKVFFTADLVGSELKSMPLALRVVEQEFTGGDESKAENYKDLRTLSEIAAQTYPKGTIESQFYVDKNGYFAVYLIRSGKGAFAEADKLRIPLNVGVESNVQFIMTRVAPFIDTALALAFIGLIAFQFWLRRKSA